MSTTLDARGELMEALTGRGVDDAMMLVSGLSDAMVEPALNAVDAWDRQREERGERIGVGLLVHMIRNGGVPVSGEDIDGSPSLGAKVRAIGLSPNGIDRGELTGIFAATARKHGLRPRALVDAGMGSRWVETPPHPSALANDPLAAARYHVLCSGVELPLPDHGLPRRPGESDADFSMRFWRWTDDDKVMRAQASLDAQRLVRAERIMQESQEGECGPNNAQLAPETQDDQETPDDEEWPQ